MKKVISYRISISCVVEVGRCAMNKKGITESKKGSFIVKATKSGFGELASICAMETVCDLRLVIKTSLFLVWYFNSLFSQYFTCDPSCKMELRKK